MHGDIAWGGNWFFLVADHHLSLAHKNLSHRQSAAASCAITALEQGIAAKMARPSTTSSSIGPPKPREQRAQLVLCPGAAFDRSPCGTGTSAKMACLHADGKLQPGQTWRQEGILGTVFEGSIASQAIC